MLGVGGNLRLVKTGVEAHEDGAFMMITPDNYISSSDDSTVAARRRRRV
ncbi:MAG: hypothetical protein JWM71_2235 [Solirubrobacteraceae bacterium]|nr:hypothetical protein [Solirubrobacteraceae bacterium]